MDKIETKAKQYYDLPYTEIIKKVKDESGEYFVGQYLEIPEAKTNADTREQLAERMREVLELSIETRIQEGDEVPLPIDSSASGTLTIRVPKSLHQSLRVRAEEEGVSLNQYALYKLAK